MTKQEHIAIGHRLRQQRNQLGLTREQFAELADIGAGYYGQIEVGTSQMSIDTLIKVSRTSRLSMEYILFGQEEGPADLAPHPDPAVLLFSPGTEAGRKGFEAVFTVG